MTIAHHNWHVRCLTVPGVDTDLALYVAFDNFRMLFGCGEGTQRAFAQRRQSMKGLSAVFVGSGRSEGRAGLPGLVMTAVDGGLSKLDIIGPSDIKQFLATTRSSVNRPSVRVDIHAMPAENSPDSSEEVYRCPELTVRAVALRPLCNSRRRRISIPDLARSSNRNCSPATSILSRDQLEQWHDNINAAMFPLDKQIVLPEKCPTFVTHTRPTDRYPLPLPDPDETETEMVYVCSATPVPGKFDIEKAIALGVPDGAIRGKLVLGETIEFEDQKSGERKIVKPEEVIGSVTPGSILIVVHCSVANMAALLSSTVFHPYQPSRPRSDRLQTMKVHLIVHRISKAVWTNVDYQGWMRAFGEGTQHLIARTDEYSHDICFSSSAWNTLHLSLLDADLFPTPFCPPSNASNDNLPLNTSFLQPYHCIPMYPPAKVTLLPNAAKDLAYPLASKAELVARNLLTKELPEYLSLCDRAREKVRADPRWPLDQREVGYDIIVTSLGTGSAMPSKHRNVACLHLDIPGVGGVLLDAGEGSLGQLRRRYGPDGVRRLHEKLRLIFVSHMHADHHLGIQHILEDRIKHGITSTLYILGPYQVALSLQESAAWQYGASQAALESIVFLDNQNCLPRTAASPLQEGIDDFEDEMIVREERHDTVPLTDDLPLSLDFVSGIRRWPARDHVGTAPDTARIHQYNRERLIQDLGLRSYGTPYVRHRGVAWGLVIEHSSGWKIVYSGDTIPSPALIRAGQGATLLIHEATLEDDKAETAALKGHSTFSQAVDVGKRMNARHTLLTHFSQRYPSLPRNSSHHINSDPGKPVIGLAFDLMSVRIGELWRMAYYMDAIEILFAGDELDEGNDTTKAVEKDVNPTIELGGTGHGKSRRATKREARAVKTRSGKNDMKVSSGTRQVNDINQLSQIKREGSPGSTLVIKRAKSDLEMNDGG